MPRVSVIIPSYNHEKYVAEAIQSVLNQTYQDFEIVITDDGSTDRTVSIIKEFSDPRIRLFSFEKNQGASVAVNNCIREAKGELIAMLSSDDVFMYNKLAKQVSLLDEHLQVDAVFSYAHIIDDNGKDFSEESHPYKHIFIQPNRTRFEWLNHFFFNGNCLCHPSMVIRKHCYDVIGMYDERFAQLPDFDLWVRLCMKFEIYVIPENLVKFRILSNETNASGNRPETRMRFYTEWAQILKNYLRAEIYDNFSKIFSTYVDAAAQNDHDLMPFHIAIIAIKEGSYISHKCFGVDTIYQLLASGKDRIENLKYKFSFNFVDLIRLTGEVDVFNILTLERSQLQLQQTQTELERSLRQASLTQSQLQQTQTELERSQLQLQQTQVELERSQATITSMQTSKFWKLRTKWFTLKNRTKQSNLIEKMSRLVKQLRINLFCFEKGQYDR